MSYLGEIDLVVRIRLESNYLEERKTYEIEAPSPDRYI